MADPKKDNFSNEIQHLRTQASSIISLSLTQGIEADKLNNCLNKLIEQKCCLDEVGKNLLRLANYYVRRLNHELITVRDIEEHLDAKTSELGLEDLEEIHAESLYVGLFKGK